MNNIKFKEILAGEHITLKIPTANFETAHMLFSVVNRNREHLGKWLPWVAQNTQPEHSYHFLQSIVKGFNENTKAEYFIYEKSTSDFCGICSAHTHFSTTHKYISLGYWLDKEKCGKGYMTEAINEHGIFKGGLLGIKRISRCTPWAKGGKDLVPTNLKGDYKWLM